MVPILAVVAIAALGMVGGQWGPAYKKYGIPPVILALVIWRTLHGGVWWEYIPLLLIWPVLFLGYGDNSWLRKHLAHDEAVKWVFAMLLSVGTVMTGLLGHYYLGAVVGALCLVQAFQIQVGSLFTWKGKSFIVDDMCRWGALGVAVCLVI